MVIDQDTTDDFLDSPPIVYADGTRCGDRLDEILDRAERGEIKLPRIPPPIER